MINTYDLVGVTLVSSTQQEAPYRNDQNRVTAGDSQLVSLTKQSASRYILVIYPFMHV